jgi:hypothetical protein
MIATGAIDLHEIALPEILNPRRVQGQHPLKTVERNGFAVGGGGIA